MSFQQNIENIIERQMYYNSDGVNLYFHRLALEVMQDTCAVLSWKGEFSFYNVLYLTQ